MRLTSHAVEKIWGLDTLPAPFCAPAGKRIGEIWFDPPKAMPELLIKYIFAAEKLSVQCHPDDAQAIASGHGTNGKDECWLVIDAAPGAKLALGFEEDIDAETMRSAALDGSIEDLLAWHEVTRGDFFFVPANTVHAIGGGVSIVEIQQNSDLTYRLYDYGRPRKLHLEDGVKVASGARFDPSTRKQVKPGRSTVLLEGPFFRVDQLVGTPCMEIRSAYPEGMFVIPREGFVLVDGDSIGPGECALASCFEAVVIAKDTVCLVAAPTMTGNPC